MISEFSLSHFGPNRKAEGKGLGNINLVMGDNSCGKTFLLKALYTMIRSHEEHGRGDDKRDFGEILSDKLYWTFQAGDIGGIVTKGKGNKLNASLTLKDNSSLFFDFGQETRRKVIPAHNNLTAREANSIFLPPKEVLSLMPVIQKSTFLDRSFGFDATYSDLILALQQPLQKGRNRDAFAQSRQTLEAMFEGKVSYDSSKQQWLYKQGNSSFSINVTAEGVKKIAILDTLLGNRYLSPDSIVFIDELESALHPTAIVHLLDIIARLAKEGIQFFIATHSYYVIKKLFLIATQDKEPIPTFMGNGKGSWKQTCLLKDGLPDNEIINASIRLFEQEFEGL